MLKTAAIATIVLSCIGVLLYLFFGMVVFISVPMQCEEKEQKHFRKIFWKSSVILLLWLVLTGVLNYLAYK